MIAVLRRRREDPAGGIGKVDHADLVPRRHHGADREVAKPHHAGDHFLFAGLQHAGILGFHDQRADFVLADLAPRLRRDGRAATAAPLPERSSSHTSGSEIFASSVIAGATLTATASGSRSAICFGTSSPTISEA